MPTTIALTLHGFKEFTTGLKAAPAAFQIELAKTMQLAALDAELAIKTAVGLIAVQRGTCCNASLRRCSINQVDFWLIPVARLIS